MREFKDQVMLKVHSMDEDRNPGLHFVGPFDDKHEARLWTFLNIWSSSSSFDIVPLIHPGHAKDGRF